MFASIVIILFVISLVSSLFSLRSLLQKSEAEKRVAEELFKNKVIFTKEAEDKK